MDLNWVRLAKSKTYLRRFISVLKLLKFPHLSNLGHGPHGTFLSHSGRYELTINMVMFDPMGKILGLFMISSVHLDSARQNVPKLIFKIYRFVKFLAKLTKFEANSDTPLSAIKPTSERLRHVDRQLVYNLLHVFYMDFTV